MSEGKVSLWENPLIWLKVKLKYGYILMIVPPNRRGGGVKAFRTGEDVIKFLDEWEATRLKLKGER